MVGKLLCVAALTAALITNAQALPSDDSPLTPDLRCLTISFRLAGSDEAQIRQAGLIAGYYYLGKVDGSAPALDLETAIHDSDLTLSDPQFAAAEARRCGAELQARGREIIEIGNRLSERERASE